VHNSSTLLNTIAKTMKKKITEKEFESGDFKFLIRLKKEKTPDWHDATRGGWNFKKLS